MQVGEPPDGVWSAALYAFVQAGLTTLAVLIVWAWLPLGETDLEPVSLSVRLHRAFLVGAPVVGGVLLVVGGVLLRAGRSRWPLILGCAVELVICAYWTHLFARISVGGYAIAFIMLVWSCFAPAPIAGIVHAVRSSTTRYLSAPVVPPGRA